MCRRRSSSAARSSALNGPSPVRKEPYDALKLKPLQVGQVVCGRAAADCCCDVCDRCYAARPEQQARGQHPLARCVAQHSVVWHGVVWHSVVWRARVAARVRARPAGCSSGITALCGSVAGTRLLLRSAICRRVRKRRGSACYRHTRRTAGLCVAGVCDSHHWSCCWRLDRWVHRTRLRACR